MNIGRGTYGVSVSAGDSSSTIPKMMSERDRTTRFGGWDRVIMEPACRQKRVLRLRLIAGNWGLAVPHRQHLDWDEIVGGSIWVSSMGELQMPPPRFKTYGRQQSVSPKKIK